MTVREFLFYVVEHSIDLETTVYVDGESCIAYYYSEHENDLHIKTINHRDTE